MLRTSPLRVLGDGDLDDALALLDAHPVTNVFVGSRVHACGLDPGRLGAEVWGYQNRGTLESMCYAGANLVPINAGPDAVRSFADRARWQGRRCSSIVGPAEPVGRMWDMLRRHWGPAREVRAVQPVMATSTPSPIEPDPGVRRVRPGELGTLLPACVAMFTEEVGVPPDAGDGGALYRARVDELIRLGRAFARIENGQVVFKAEVGAVTPYACQVQGVWVRPDLRGRRYAVHGMAAVLNEALRSIAPTVSLYVNDYNTPARATYRRVGFSDVETFSSILF